MVKAGNRKAAMGFIFVTLLIDVMGWGIIIPVIPDLLKELTGRDTSYAAEVGGWLTASFAIMQVLCAPLIGNLSDRYGRRPVLLFSLFGFGLDYVFTAFAPTLAWLFVGRIIAGITGASITTASAYIADISTSENRAQNFGMIGAAFGLGFIIGPGIGGLLGQMGTRAPFIAAAILCLLNWLWGYFVLPESLPPASRRKFEWRRANPLGSFRLFLRYKSIGELVIALILIYIAAHAVQSNWSYFTVEKFGWSSGLIGVSLAVVGVLVAIVQGGLIRYINPLLGNERSVYVGLILYAIGMFLFAFAAEGWMMFVFLIPYCLGGIANPALQSIISGHVSSSEQGELQGALASLMSVTSIIGPPLMTGLFAYFTHDKAPVYFPGVSFLLAGMLLLMSALLAYHALKSRSKEPV